MIPAQEIVERGLTAADGLGADGCIVLVDESSHVDVRFALNTTTTNGVQRGRSVSVIALASGSVGSVTNSLARNGAGTSAGRTGHAPLCRRRSSMRAGAIT